MHTNTVVSGTCCGLGAHTLWCVYACCVSWCNGLWTTLLGYCRQSAAQTGILYVLATVRNVLCKCGCARAAGLLGWPDIAWYGALVRGWILGLVSQALTDAAGRYHGFDSVGVVHVHEDMSGLQQLESIGACVRPVSAPVSYRPTWKFYACCVPHSGRRASISVTRFSPVVCLIV